MEKVISVDKTIIKTFNSFYQSLRKFFSPAVPYIFPRRPLPKWLTYGKHVEVITANQITVARSLMALLVAGLIHQKYLGTGFVVFVIAGILDFVDGLVATVHRKLGFKDNPDLGAFLDAFCDKIFYNLMFVLVLLLGEYGNMSIEIKIWLFTVSSLSILCEIILAIIRVDDYYHNTFGNKDGARDLRAKGAGKLKFTLELIGLGGLILSLPEFDSWTFWVGISCITLSLPFAILSLKQKLQQRKHIT